MDDFSAITWRAFYDELVKIGMVKLVKPNAVIKPKIPGKAAQNPAKVTGGWEDLKKQIVANVGT